MPNPHSVYMHDTNHKNLFNSDYRFQSSGCARVNDPRDLAAWLLQDNEGWSRREIDAGIATGKRIDIRLARSVPVAWIYLTGWATGDGTVHFRKDVYDHDDVPVRPVHGVAAAPRGHGGARLRVTRCSRANRAGPDPGSVLPRQPIAGQSIARSFGRAKTEPKQGLGRCLVRRMLRPAGAEARS